METNEDMTYMQATLLTLIRLFLPCLAGLALLNPLAAEVRLRLDVGDPELYLVRPGENKAITVVVTNEGGEPISGRLVVEVESYDGSKFEVAEALKLAPADEERVEIPREKLGDLGIKWVRAKLQQERAG